jgi:hypothetical protein
MLPQADAAFSFCLHSSTHRMSRSYTVKPGSREYCLNIHYSSCNNCLAMLNNSPVLSDRYNAEEQRRRVGGETGPSPESDLEELDFDTFSQCSMRLLLQQFTDWRAKSIS